MPSEDGPTQGAMPHGISRTHKTTKSWLQLGWAMTGKEPRETGLWLVMGGVHTGVSIRKSASACTHRFVFSMCDAKLQVKKFKWH